VAEIAADPRAAAIVAATPEVVRAVVRPRRLFVFRRSFHVRTQWPLILLSPARGRLPLTVHRQEALKGASCSS